MPQMSRGSPTCAEETLTLHPIFLFNRVMLADKLLGKADYECSREVRTLELLKLRFGDANLHNCEARPRPWRGRRGCLD